MLTLCRQPFTCTAIDAENRSPEMASCIPEPPNLPETDPEAEREIGPPVVAITGIDDESGRRVARLEAQGRTVARSLRDVNASDERTRVRALVDLGDHAADSKIVRTTAEIAAHPFLQRRSLADVEDGLLLTEEDVDTRRRRDLLEAFGGKGELRHQVVRVGLGAVALGNNVDSGGCANTELLNPKSTS